MSRTAGCIGPDVGEQPLPVGECPNSIVSADALAEAMAGEEEGILEELVEEPVEAVTGAPAADANANPGQNGALQQRFYLPLVQN